MKPMLYRILTLALLSLPTQAWAESGKAWFAKLCLEAAQTGNSTSFRTNSSLILGWREIDDKSVQETASECLSIGFGERWVYDEAQARFVTYASVADEWEKKAVAKAQRDAEERSAREAEEALAELDRRNRSRVAEAVFQACSNLLESDPTAALTSEPCIDSFLANGLPE